MAIGRAYRIKKSAVKAYGYTKPPSQKGAARRGPRYAANGSVTHIAAINGRGSYRSARRSMAGLSANKRKQRAGSALSSAKKTAFAKRMRALKKNGYSGPLAKPELRRKRGGVGAYSGKTSSTGGAAARTRRIHQTHDRAYGRSGTTKYAKNGYRVKKRLPGYSLSKNKSRRRVGPARSGTKKKSATATRNIIMARKNRRKKKAAARKPVARRVKRRVKRRKSSAKRSAVAPKRKKRPAGRRSTARAAAPKRRKRRKARKTTLKANRRRSRRRLRKNYGTSAGARKGWRTRKAKSRRSSPKRRRRGKRKLSMRKSAVAARRRRRALARGGATPKRRRRSRRKLAANRKRRTSRRRMRSNKRRTRRASPRRRVSRRRMSSNRKRRGGRRLRRNGRRRMFRKNGVMEPVLFVLKTGGLALGGFIAHKVLSNALTTYGLSKIFGTPAVAVSTPTATAVVPATSGLGGLSLDPAYQKLIGGGIIAALGVWASAKLIKDTTVRNTVATGIAVSFTTTLLAAVMTKFAPQYAGLLSGADDGTAARLSAMYGMGGTSIMPRYAAIGGGRGMGEYFQSGVGALGEYFQSGVSGGLGEYFQSGLGALPSYEANAGYGANPDLMEAAAGMGARETMSTNHVDPHGDLDRELTIAEAAAGVGAYEAAAGYGAISTVPSSSTWIPGSSNGQLWAGTRSISNGQSATEMVPAGILQTDGGQGVFG